MGQRFDQPPGNIQFSLDYGATEVLRFEPDGRVFVRGELVDDNAEIYRGFCDWLRKALAPQRQTCTCDIFALMRVGCQCGALIAGDE